MWLSKIICVPVQAWSYLRHLLEIEYLDSDFIPVLGLSASMRPGRDTSK
jgi:hypothetical protein